MTRKKIIKVIVIVLISTLATFVVIELFVKPMYADGFQKSYTENCSSCHGKNLEGTTLGPALVGTDLIHGETVDEIEKNINKGFLDKGMPAFTDVLNKEEIKKIAIFISEERNSYSMEDYKLEKSLRIPENIIKTERYNFRLETVVTDLNPWPYSITPLPDGRILLSEKTQGLSFISQDGKKSELITGTPKAYDDGFMFGPYQGTGWLLDVAIHPDYEENGWIYLSYGDRQTFGEIDKSLCKLIRGRIKDGAWINQETIWEADLEMYTPDPETTVGGRICFDGNGHVFMSLGEKKNEKSLYEPCEGIQDLSQPYGKIYRMHDDGRVPEDNPFVDVEGALKSIWTYGHRSPQGLEVDPNTGELWGTEMGPRGGDEVNLLLPGKNYGWPLHSKGMNYDGSEVAYGKELGIEYDLEDIEQPVVDLTPSPAVSSFVFYQGDVFPEWGGNLIVGTLKATQLFRMEIKDGKLVHRETLLDDLARIRDVEVGPDGNIYLLLEHKAGGQIVRMVAGG